MDSASNVVCTTLSCPESDPSFDVMLDRMPQRWKPSRGDPAWGQISHTLATQCESVPLPVLASLLTTGCSFSPSVFRDGKRTNDTWVRQQVFALDCEKGYGPTDFLHLCGMWGVRPVFLYPSFNHTEDQPRFRAVFACDQVITDRRLRQLTQGLLMDMFDGKHIGQPTTIDPQCRDFARFFLGTNKPLIYEDYGARINPIGLLDAYLRRKRDTDANHFSEWVKRIADDYQIELRGHRELGVVGLDFVSNSVQASGENTVGVYIHNTPTLNSPELSRRSTVQWNDLLFEIRWKDKSSNSNHPKVAMAMGDDALLPFKPNGRLTTNDKTTLVTRCQLLREYLSGEKHLHHGERRILITNLQWREGGVKWFREGLTAREDYRPDTLIEDARRYAMRPEGCRNCPYHNGCDHRTNLLQQIEPRRRECRQVRPSPPRKSLEETRQRLREIISSCFASEEKCVFVIKCDAGVGKTEEVLRQSLEGVCVAFDTHRLKREAYQRLGEHGGNIYLWPNPPPLPEELADRLQRCYDIGAGSAAEVFRLALDHPSVCMDHGLSAAIQRYLLALSEIHVQSSVFTTHEKAYQLQTNPNLHTFVFDEDFTKTLIQIDQVRIRDIETVRKLIRESGDTPYDQIDLHLKSILHAPSRMTHAQPMRHYEPKLIHALLMRTPKSFESPLESLFSCDAYRKDSSDPDAAESVFCIARQRLREDKKFIVLSATADETVCRLLFGDRLRFIDLSGTELMGQVHCHTKRSFSKQSIYKDTAGFVEQVERDTAQYAFDGIITHKLCTESSEGGLYLRGTQGRIPVFGTFGGLQGLDSFGGKNIAVYGTPYPPEFVVKLWAHVLGIDVDEDGFAFAERLVSWDEYEAVLPTVSEHPSIQRLYLWLAHSEIVQAVGRARLVNHPCTVHVFAKLPVSGGQLVTGRGGLEGV